MLREQDFFVVKHGWVWSAFASLHERNFPIDLRSTADELDRTNRLEGIGGQAFLTRLVTLVPSALHVAAYGKTVEEAAIRRRLLRAASDIAKAAYDKSTDIAEVVSYEAYDYRHNPEYARVYIATGSGGNTSTSSRHATLPARGSLDYDLSDRVWTNEAAIQDDAIGRLAESAERIPERLVLRCKGRRLSQLAPGDIVTLTTTRTHSRRDGSAGWSGRSVMVDQVACDWEGGTVEIGLLVYPESSDVFA